MLCFYTIPFRARSQMQFWIWLHLKVANTYASIFGIEVKAWRFKLAQCHAVWVRSKEPRPGAPKQECQVSVPWVILCHGNRSLQVHEYLGLFYLLGIKFHTQKWHYQSCQVFFKKKKKQTVNKYLLLPDE